MKLNHRIQVDLLEVFRAGKFEFIKPGHTKQWILDNFPDPDDYEPGRTLETAGYWRYGCIDFFFDDDCLTQIFTDDIDSLDGGASIEIGKWILGDPNSLSVGIFIRNLVREQINFVVKHHRSDFICQTSIGLVNSFIHLSFEPMDEGVIDFAAWYAVDRKVIDPNEHKLSSVTLMNRADFEAVYLPKI